MKRLRFEELVLLSRNERSAVRLNFHPKVTVLKGDNDTGKSSVLKSLYSTLGADSPIVNDSWKRVNAMSSLRFSIDGDRYRMIRQASRYCLFDGFDRLLGSYTSIGKGLAPRIAELFDFRLTLHSKSGDDRQAPPAFLFLPFYIDQDAGWNDKLCSFQNLQQFKRPIRDLLHFHMGIKPPGYYRAKADLHKSEADAAEPRQSVAAYEKLLESLDDRLKTADFSLDLDVFKEEVETLLARARALQTMENEQKARMKDAYEVRSAIQDQLGIVKRTLAELSDDLDFATEQDGDDVSCPTCHASYNNGFAARFALALDEERCVELLAELEEELGSAERQYTSASSAVDDARRLAAEVHAILAVRRGELEFKDVIQSAGRYETRALVVEHTNELKRRIGELDTAGESARRCMKTFENKERREEVENFYFSEVSRLLGELDVKSSSLDAYRRLEGRIKETGSDLPRAVLGFYLSVVRTIGRYSECALCPLVVDSPRQQDQDRARWHRVLSVLRSETPSDAQLIVALTDDGDLDFGGSVVELDRQRELLRAEEYDAAERELTPLFQAALKGE
jgi:hypothetical protein